MFDIFTFTQGLLLGLGMFACPGPKDILILRQALLRQPAHELLAVGVVSDLLLIWLGMAGISAALGRAPHWQAAALWLGAGLMALHGLMAAMRAAKGTEITGLAKATPLVPARAGGFATLLLVSFFNPAAWLDTVLVIGTAGAALPSAQQWSFASGAVTASFAWFTALVMGARYAGRWVTSPHLWRTLDALVAIAMLGLAGWMVYGLL